MTSARDIIIDDPVTHADVSPGNGEPVSETTTLFRNLRKLMAECGSNKNDRAIMVITALIESGIDTGPRIVGAMKQLDFNRQHAAMMLKEGLGRNRDQHRWSKDDEGKYTPLL